MASTIGTAYIQIEPTTKGIAGKIEKEMNSAGSSGGNAFKGAFGKVLGTVGSAAGGIVSGFASVTTTAVSTVGKASVSLLKEATSNFAEFEQLQGGAELMFGSAYDFIAEKSENAFSKIQMSQNDYLQQVNGFAVGLKTALGGDEMAAAQLADRIVTAEADVVAATGNSQEAVQNAFNGIMKSNYTMLDNLQLGITPTKAGMQEVIDKVNEWNKANGEASNYVIDNLADVQNALVDYIEMQGLAGYAENEGAETIQGALASTQAAWQNLMTGLVSGGDISGAIDGLLESAGALWTNLEPVMIKGFDGLIRLISQALPQIVQTVGTLLQRDLPLLINAIVVIADTLGSTIMDILPTIFNNSLPVLIKSAARLITTLGQGLVESIPILVPSLIELINMLTMTLIELAPQLLEVGLQLLVALSMGIGESLPTLIPALVDVIITIVDYLVSNADLLIAAAVALVGGLVKGLINSLPKLIEAGKKLLQAVKDGWKMMFSLLGTAASEMVTNLKNKIIEKKNAMIEAGKNLVKSIKEGLVNAWNDVINWFKGKIEELKEKFTSAFQINLPTWMGGGGNGGGTTTQTIQGYRFSPTANSFNSGYSGISSALQSVTGNTNVIVKLEGDADRLFRVIQAEQSRNAMLVGV